MFFTALFPQFIDQSAALLPQFLILTSIFMALSVSSLSIYAALASRAKGLLIRPALVPLGQSGGRGDIIGFGAAILTIRRQTA